MYIEIERECSACGSRHYEHFHRRHYSGIRCITCGHERITEDRRKPPGEQAQQISYTNHTRPIF